ncbi:MAG: Gfo/Idh/MocA family oxidoreductase [Methanospirillaceae archaeon]|nr:Gfo/Idh/MocA family oxidoreductase [Methanospirillaceae archaeon]
MDVGVIGVGTMGMNHVRVYSELKEVSSVTVFDLNTQLARDVAEKNDATLAGSMEELLKNVEAVSLCVPTPRHFETAKTVLERGIHLLIEKPICLSSEEGMALRDILPKDLIIGIGHIERFNPIVAEIQKITKDPLYVEFKRHNPASSRVTGSSVVEDLMIHDIDIMLHSLFYPCYTLQSMGNADIATALFGFDGVPVYLSASRKASKKIRLIHIEQEDMTIEGDFMTQEVYVYRKPEQYSIEDQRYVQENIVEKVLVSQREPLKSELATFIRCIKQDLPFPITPDQAIQNVAVCEEIKQKFL